MNFPPDFFFFTRLTKWGKSGIVSVLIYFSIQGYGPEACHPITKEVFILSEECTHDCSTCAANCASREKKNEDPKAGNPASSVKKVIAVVSGKGGVGKSMVTSLLACAQRKKGSSVAIMDADITGPSIPKVFGVNERAMGVEEGIVPAETRTGIKLMSMNLLLDNPTDPVVWRGPIIGGVVQQFWKEVWWGDVDYMFVDMPPGTGDVPLTVFQSLPVDGIVIVTSPQELVSVIVEKAVKMAELMNIPVLGIVENMSYFVCPDCGKKHYIFGESRLEELARTHNIPVTARLPIDPAIPQAADAGDIEGVETNMLDDILAAVEKARE